MGYLDNTGLAYLWNKIKSIIPTKVSDLTNDSGFTSNVGTITGITMNGASKGTSGVVNLGTVITEHQDISGKANSADVYTKTQVDDMIEDVAYFGDTVGNVTTADFNAQTDTVWNKTQVLGSTQQATARNNINAQETLVSGTNIKTINNESILGSGNITISGGSGGGGASAINDLTDVNISSPSDGQALLYDSSTSKWVNGTVSSGGSPTFTVYTAAWTASSSSNSTTTLSDTLTLPAGLYIVRIQLPVTQNSMTVQLDGTNITQRSNTYYIGTNYAEFMDFIEVNSGGGSIYIRSASNAAQTFTYLERGSLKALRLM